MLCRPEEEQSHDALIDRLETLEKKLEDIDAGNYIPSPDPKKTVQGDIEPLTETKGENIASKKTISDVVHQVSDHAQLDRPKQSDNSKADLPKKDEEISIGAVDIAKAWPQILKMIKKERVAIYTLLMDAKFEHESGNVVTLIFPPDQGFFVTAVEKEDNRKFIEDMILKATGKEVRVNCLLEGQNKGLFVEEDPLVQKAIDIFGEDNIEIVDDK